VKKVKKEEKRTADAEHVVLTLLCFLFACPLFPLSILRSRLHLNSRPLPFPALDPFSFAVSLNCTFTLSLVLFSSSPFLAASSSFIHRWRASTGASTWTRRATRSGWARPSLNPWMRGGRSLAGPRTRLHRVLERRIE